MNAVTKTEPVKTHWKKTFNKDYLGSHDLDNGRGSYDKITATIREVKLVMVKDPTGDAHQCDVAYFTDKAIKPMILNVGACNTIAGFAKSPYIEDWTGVKIMIQVENVKAFGVSVDALRINPNQPRTEMPEMTPEHTRFGDLIKAYAEKGEAALVAARKGFIVSDELAERIKADAALLSQD